MQRFRTVSAIAAAILLLIVAFFAGRSSVTIPDPIEVLSESDRAQKQKLTAITSRNTERLISSGDHIQEVGNESTVPFVELAAGKIFHRFPL